MKKVAVIGASGFTGEMLVSLLYNHPQVDLNYLSVRTDKSIKFSDLFPKYRNKIDITCHNLDKEEAAKNDIVFLSLPHKVSFEQAGFFLDKGKVVIDLSADYRIKDLGIYKKYYGVDHGDSQNLAQAVYGLPEFMSDKIKSSKLIANPGCYPTASLLSSLPLFKEKIVENEIIIDAKSGISGAGKKAKQEYGYTLINDNLWAYKPLVHQHLPEMVQEIKNIGGFDVNLRFCPHVIPTERGIYTTAYFWPKRDLDYNQVKDIYLKYYQNAPFVRVLDTLPVLKDVVGTNFCDIGFGFSEDKKMLIVCSAIDNLIKGAAGQAIQNMNIICGFDQTTGLL